MAYLNKIRTLNKKWGFTLPAVVTSILFPILFSLSLTSAQGPSKEVYVHYRIYPDLENKGVEKNILDAIDTIGKEDPKTQQGQILIKAKFLTTTSLYDRRGPITENEEFYEYVKDVAKGKFALTIEPGTISPVLRTMRVQFTLRDLDKNMSYDWETNVDINNDEKSRDRLRYVSERIRSIIRGGPYKFVFACCFIYEGGIKNDNIKSLSKNLPRTLKEKLKIELSRKEWKQHQIDVEYIYVPPEKCKELAEKDIENYFRDYDCIVKGTIDTVGNLVNIQLDYSKGGKTGFMKDVKGKITDNLAELVMQRICEYLPEIMGK